MNQSNTTSISMKKKINYLLLLSIFLLMSCQDEMLTEPVPDIYGSYEVNLRYTDSNFNSTESWMTDKTIEITRIDDTRLTFEILDSFAEEVILELSGENDSLRYWNLPGMGPYSAGFVDRKNEYIIEGIVHTWGEAASDWMEFEFSYD